MTAEISSEVDPDELVFNNSDVVTCTRRSGTFVETIEAGWMWSMRSKKPKHLYLTISNIKISWNKLTNSILFDILWKILDSWSSYCNQIVQGSQSMSTRRTLAFVSVMRATMASNRSKKTVVAEKNTWSWYLIGRIGVLRQPTILIHSS